MIKLNVWRSHWVRLLVAFKAVYRAFQEQLCERERAIHELERKMEEKDRELHNIKLDNEAVC